MGIMLDFTTRIGTLEFRVQHTRDGKVSPSVFERYQRNEKALLAAMLEMYISGVSTLKVTKIVEELCEKRISKSFVSSRIKHYQYAEYYCRVDNCNQPWVCRNWFHLIHLLFQILKLSCNV